MARTILTYPDPRLAAKAEPIAEVTPELRALAEEMRQIMYDSEGVGLAAPQVGECCRLVVVDISGPKERTDFRVLVNPVVVSKEGSVVSEDEGCLSVKDYRANVERAEKVVVKAQDLEGEPVEIEADGFMAVCLQHEIDHLDGVLFIDRISRLKRSLYDKKVKKWQKKSEQDAE